MRYMTYGIVAAFACLAAVGKSQMLGELEAAQGGQAQLDGASVTGGANPGYIDRANNAAGAANANFNNTGVLPNPGAGFAPPPAAGLPGAATPALGPANAYPGLGGPAMVGQPAVPGQPGYPGQPGVATPTPIPTIKVLVGKRVHCSVCGNLLDDAVQLTVPQTDQDAYFDDGIHDNGIANDGIRGNVQTIKNLYIGQECEAVKTRLINVVRRAEDMDPMKFFGYHVMAVDPIGAHPQMPSVLDKEQQRDEALRDWNNKFLADYRLDKNDPKSEFFQVYVPEAPQVPRYPVPPGYVSPQKLAEGVVPGQVPVAPGADIYNGDPVLGGGVI